MVKLSKKVLYVVMLLLGAGWVVLSSILFPPVEAAPGVAPRAGAIAPDFELAFLEGGSTTLSDLRGNIVVLNLWASWCAPCRAEMPALERVHVDYAGKGVMVLGVNMTSTDSLGDVRRFLEEQQITFPVLLDESGEVARLYENRALPTTFFIRPDGVIDDVVVGGPMAESMIRARILKIQEGN